MVEGGVVAKENNQEEMIFSCFDPGTVKNSLVSDVDVVSVVVVTVVVVAEVVVEVVAEVEVAELVVDVDAFNIQSSASDVFRLTQDLTGRFGGSGARS